MNLPNINHKEFQVNKATDEQMNSCAEIARAFNQLLNELEYICNQSLEFRFSREFNIAKTKLEEACFYAKKSIFYPQTRNNNENK